MIDAVEKWRTRDLSEETIKYLFLDGVNFDMRIDGSIEKVPVLVAIGVTKAGKKLVLCFQAGDKESAATWREFFMEIVAGENACYTLLAFTCLKMELHWRSNPIGKVRNNLPFFKRIRI